MNKLLGIKIQKKKKKKVC